MGTITFLIVLSILVFIHELGHFLAAKSFGVTVHTFSIGFGKKIFSKDFKGTTWQIALIPLGGYVRMKGQDDSKPSLKEEGDDSYNSKKPWQRIVILFAGPFANFLLAAVLYFTMALMGASALSPTIGKVLENSPAFNAGLMSNDEVVRINESDIKSWDDLSSIIKDTNNPLTFYIKRDGKLLAKTLYPKVSQTQNIFGETIDKRMVGISPAPKIVTLHLGFLESLEYAYNKTIESSKMIFLGVAKLIQGIIPSSEVGGVISIGKVISDASESGIITLFAITALISVNLGVLNLLPIPALDGGHIMFNLYEMITRRKPSDKVFVALTITGWVVLAGLMLLGLYNDINRFFG